jgi:hypothetical protein
VSFVAVAGCWRMVASVSNVALKARGWKQKLSFFCSGFSFVFAEVWIWKILCGRVVFFTAGMRLR